MQLASEFQIPVAEIQTGLFKQISTLHERIMQTMLQNKEGSKWRYRSASSMSATKGAGAALQQLAEKMFSTFHNIFTICVN